LLFCKSRFLGKPTWIVRGGAAHEHADPPHSLGLLRVCRERPSRSRAAEREYELPSSDADCHLPVPNGISLLYHDPIGRSVTDYMVVGRREVWPLIRIVVGAHAVLKLVRQKPEKYPWLTQLLARKPFKVVAIALANKMARIAWALLVKGGPYRARALVAAA
jgi:hypothetical protein